MKTIIKFFAVVLIVAFLVAFAWRVCVTIGIPVIDYPFSTVFSNTAWVFGLIYVLFKLLPLPTKS